MNIKERLTWFKSNFGQEIEEATDGTPISIDLVSAIALQETGYLWSALLRHHAGNLEKVLEGCVGDTIDYPSRRAFPRNREALESISHGNELFGIARMSLAGLAEINGTYRKVYERDPDRFCRGYGILQYDLQHMKGDPDFFLKMQWSDFGVCLDKCLKELTNALRKRGFEGRDELSDFDAATVAIVYNRGRYDPARELRQGHRDSSGKYYGEYIFDYIKLSQSIGADHSAVGDIVPDDIPMNYFISARNGLNLRGGPGTEYEALDTIDNGIEVNVLRFMGARDEWALVDLKGDGRLDGFMYSDFLEPTIDHGTGEDRVEDDVRSEMLAGNIHDNLVHTQPAHDGECVDC